MFPVLVPKESTLEVTNVDFKVRLDRILSNLIYLKMSSFIAEGLD